MKIFDLLRIAVKNLKNRWMVLFVIGIAVSVFCLSFAGAVFTTVQQEKSLPYELNITSGAANLTDSNIVKISEIPNVTAITPVLEVFANVKAGEYSSQLTLTGVNAAYLNEQFTKGGIFSDSSVMPYIVLNEAACKQFKEKKDNTEYEAETEAPDIDWLNTGISVQLSEDGRPIVSRVCGILSGNEEEQQPAAYISISSARELLQSNEQSTDYIKANVRITNMGCADSVSNEIIALGFNIENSNEDLQVKWDTKTKEMTYLIVGGIFCLLCSSVLLAAWRKVSLMEHKEEWRMLRWIGMKEKDIGRIFIIQTLILSLIGIFIGIIVSTSLPSFLSPELNEASIFIFPIPYEIAILSAVICITASMLSLIKIRKKVIDLH